LTRFQLFLDLDVDKTCRNISLVLDSIARKGNYDSKLEPYYFDHMDHCTDLNKVDAKSKASCGLVMARASGAVMTINPDWALVERPCWRFFVFTFFVLVYVFDVREVALMKVYARRPEE